MGLQLQADIRYKTCQRKALRITKRGGITVANYATRPATLLYPLEKFARKTYTWDESINPKQPILISVPKSVWISPM